jgi:hypothetical protein
MSTSLNPASLVDPSLHSTATLQLVDLALTDCLIGECSTNLGFTPLSHSPLFGSSDYVAQCTVEAVDFALGRLSPSSSTSNPKDVHRHAEFTEFVSNVLSRSQVRVPVILVSLVYIHRAKSHLSIRTAQWACERVFLGALILAAKVSSVSPNPTLVTVSIGFMLTCDLPPLLVHE